MWAARPKHIIRAESSYGCSSVVTFFKGCSPLQATSLKGFSLERLRPFVVISPCSQLQRAFPLCPEAWAVFPYIYNVHKPIEPMAAPAGTLPVDAGYVGCLIGSPSQVISLLMREHRRRSPRKLILLTYTDRCDLTRPCKLALHSLYAHIEIVKCHAHM